MAFFSNEPVLAAYRTLFSSWNQLHTIGINTSLALAEQQLTFGKAWLNTWASQEPASAIKGPKEFFAVQADLASKQQQLLQDHVQQTTKVVTETKTAVTAWYENLTKAVAQPAEKIVTKKAA